MSIIFEQMGCAGMQKWQRLLGYWRGLPRAALWDKLLPVRNDSLANLERAQAI